MSPQGLNICELVSSLWYVWSPASQLVSTNHSFPRGTHLPSPFSPWIGLNCEPMEYCENYRVWLLRLGNKRYFGLCLVLFPGITWSGGIQLPCCKVTQAISWMDLPSQEPRVSSDSYQKSISRRGGTFWNQILQSSQAVTSLPVHLFVTILGDSLSCTNKPFLQVQEFLGSEGLL